MAIGSHEQPRSSPQEPATPATAVHGRDQAIVRAEPVAAVNRRHSPTSKSDPAWSDSVHDVVIGNAMPATR